MSKKPNAMILQANGTNRDRDVAEAFSLAGAEPVLVPLNYLYTGRVKFSEFQILVLPGGFSYADAFGAGNLLALDIKSYFSDEIKIFLECDKPILGICNGFQALIKANILPGQMPNQSGDENENGRKVTLTFNNSGHFECRWINMHPVSKVCIWTRDIESAMACPIAHGEGRFLTCDDSILSTISGEDMIALTYIQENGFSAGGKYPDNPNGSSMDIAGICNSMGNILGLMPHPENHIHYYQHPQWTRGVTRGNCLSLFISGVRYAEGL